MNLINKIGFCILVLFILHMISCGDLKIKAGIDDETIDKINNIFDDGEEQISDEEQNSDHVTADNFDGTNEEDEDTGGGITVIEPAGYDKNEESYFMGTWSVSFDYYAAYSSRCDIEYNFPTVIRGYSHTYDEFIDFETSSGQLAWVAEVYPDETFDFSVQFLDTFGKPSVQLDCTCNIEEGYGDYYP
ncbi:hypothetical protein KJ708_00910, partial [bacterium]|nr:hypothetical protein [bacterium]MBU1919049.1 hypothetical protein [bacterium]